MTIEVNGDVDLKIADEPCDLLVADPPDIDKPVESRSPGHDLGDPIPPVIIGAAGLARATVD
jgi:hypothetical protein